MSCSGVPVWGNIRENRVKEPDRTTMATSHLGESRENTFMWQVEKKK